MNKDLWWCILLAVWILGPLVRRAGVATARWLLRQRARRRELAWRRGRARALALERDRRQLLAVAQAFGRRPVRLVDTVIVDTR